MFVFVGGIGGIVRHGTRVDASGCVTERKTAMDTHAVLGRSGAYLIVVFIGHGALLGSRLGRGDVVSASQSVAESETRVSSSNVAEWVGGSGLIVPS